MLHDPNSPARNDELYIPVLEALVSSPWLDRWERIAPQHDLRMASQNRIGRPANDFRYTTADGATRRMYDIRAEYLLLFINNPGCNMCKTVREAISASPMLNELIERGKLKVLALFPDEDLTEWQEYRPQIPARWINAYDKGCVVRDRELYDLKAIPALYLLDRVKRLYTTQADSSADFVQQVHVDSVVAESRLAGEPQTVFETLSDRLDVRARRSVTYTETIPFGTVTRENDAEYQDYRETVRQGQTGEAVVTAEIQTLDGEENERTIVARTVLRSASDEIVEVGTKNIGIGTGSFVRPVSGYTFTSAFKWRWGRLHSGVDLAVPEGTPVRASDNGKVILAENSGDGYGNYIILDHGNGFKTLYGHNSALCVSVGDIVSQGDLIAYSGNTGNSTGPHLHFEIHLDDEKVDPERFLSF